MFKKKKIVFADIVYSFLILFYLAMGIFAFCICGHDFNDKSQVLAILIILSSVPHILIYIINRTKKSYLVIGLVGTAFGILFLTSNFFSDDQICMVWGVLDICRGTVEIINVAPTVKEHKKELIEIGISLGDIVIGVLLCIHLVNGMQLHLIYLGLAFVLTAAKNIFELYWENYNAKRVDNN